MRAWAAFCALVALSGFGAPAAAAPVTAGGGPATAALASCDTDLKRLNPLTGWQARWTGELAAQASGSPATLLEDWRGAPALLAEDMTSLRAGLDHKTAAPASVARLVLMQIDAWLAAGISPAAASAEQRAFLDGPLREAIVAYRDFLEDSYIPAAPQGSSLAGGEQGRACYAAAVREWTSLDVSADEIEAAGRELMAAARTRLLTYARAAPDELPTVLARLRAGDLSSKATRQTILDTSKAAMERARIALATWFDGPAPPQIEIEPVAAGLEASLPAGFYRPASGGKPAAYMINLSRPKERALMAEAIAFHETLPGHHLQMTATADGRFNAGFIEGWGVYAEHLAAQMGLYSGAEALMGSAAKDLWGASRLIIEPGLHVRGWSRDQAVDWMVTNTTVSRTEAEVEVDRYLALPGQSLTYMLGYREITAARDRAKLRAGADFDIKAFHKAVLQPGPRPLTQVRSLFPAQGQP